MADQKRYGMVIDLRRCVGCHACTVACRMENSVPDDCFRSWVMEADKGSYPNVTRVKLPRLCNQCQDAPCVAVCPVKATYRDVEGGGVIKVDSAKCIGCRYCIASCPYNARYLHPAKGVADKCDLCLERIKVGLLPACVSTCVSHARFFGDFNDPDSEVSRLIREHEVQTLRPELRTRPSVYYIGLAESLANVNQSSLTGRR